MTSVRRIRHLGRGDVLIARARWCNTFWSRFRGYAWQRTLPPGDALVLVEAADSRMGSAIHMLFMFFDLGVIWVNDAGEVVDKVHARPWRLSYAPQAPARYAIEASPALLTAVAVGDRVAFEPLEDGA